MQANLAELKRIENESFERKYGVSKDIADEIKTKYGLEILVRKNISYNSRNNAPSGYRLITYAEMITIQKYLRNIGKGGTCINASSTHRIPTDSFWGKHRSSGKYIQPAEITLVYNDYTQKIQSTYIDGTAGIASSISYDDSYKNALNKNCFTCIYVKIK